MTKLNAAMAAKLSAGFFAHGDSGNEANAVLCRLAAAQPRTFCLRRRSGNSAGGSAAAVIPAGGLTAGAARRVIAL